MKRGEPMTSTEQEIENSFNGESLDTMSRLKQQLYQLMPEVFTEGIHGKIDWEKLKATLGEDITFSNERYVLNWAGKSDSFRNLQEPTTKTLTPAPEESINFDTTQNIFIEGENLEVLKVLQKSYFGKIKMIYIDPPYNTGNDSFIYPDKFSETKDAYLKRVGDKDEEGYRTKEGRFGKNSKENGQYHSNWLNMMYPRLFLARNLLKDDGVIFISIDDNEVHNLRLIMNEIFGEENFVANFVWQHRKSSQNDVDVSLSHNYTLCYGKNREIFKLISLQIAEEKFSNPDNDPRGDWVADPLDAPNIRPNLTYPIINPITGDQHLPPSGRHWRFSQEKLANALSDKRIIFGKTGKSRPQYKRFKSEALAKGTNPFTVWTEMGTATEATKELMQLFEGAKYFDTPKPKRLINEILKISVTSEDLILDFFSGSATTAHAVLDLNAQDGGNLKFICVQLPEPCDEQSEAYKAGYATIAEIAKERIRRVIKKIKEAQNGQLDFSNENQDLGVKVFKLTESNFKQWQKTPQNEVELVEQLELMVNPIQGDPTHEAMLTELVLKSGLSLTSVVEAKGGFYLINQTELAIILDKATEHVFDAIIKLHPAKVIALDSVFENNDQLKTNVALQFKDAGIAFQTI